MNDTAQSSSRMASKVKSSFLSPSRSGNSSSVPAQPGSNQSVGSQPSAAQSSNTPPAQPTAAQSVNMGDGSDQIPDAKKLAIFEQVLESVEQNGQAQNQGYQLQTQQQDQQGQLNPPHAVKTGSKEAADLSASPDQGPVDAGAIQHVEHEKNPEVPVEVEGYLKKVEDIAEKKPQEVYIADGTEETEKAAYPSRPVVVLPISEEVEKAGKKKNATFSIRWLVEWSHKIIKIFAGKVIYREEAV